VSDFCARLDRGLGRRVIELDGTAILEGDLMVRAVEVRQRGVERPVLVVIGELGEKQ
jgi:hypothetical protein